ncbi:MAG: hypothetical protein IJP11_07160 [Oscillospiraceae bacterium]|nr:hypothetical protein [Oscillospiraceae bacterium]
MKEFEVLSEAINPCGGSKHSVKEFFEVVAESPEAWVRENGRWPILDIAKSGEDTVITTGDCAGNIIRYTFSE